MSTSVVEHPAAAPARRSIPDRGVHPDPRQEPSTAEAIPVWEQKAIKRWRRSAAERGYFCHM
ncbi:MAG: hypothetical protein HYS45_02700 [Parcubacteria group bacterium]|nr:hypothetical protein [Parcubacteria group bacterium]